MCLSAFKTFGLRNSTGFRPIILIAFMWLLGSGSAVSQTLDYWRYLLHRESLSDTLNANTIHASSYARSGSNADYRDFLGIDTDGCKILCDFTGPGVISHIWTTYRPLTTQRLKIYVDNMSTPLIDTTIVALFGNVAPFVPPLAQSVNLAHFSDVPIPFNSRLKITTTANNLYYEVLGQRFPEDSTVESFSLNPSSEYLARLDSLESLFSNPEIPALSDQPVIVQSGASTIAPGQLSEVLAVEATGTCRRLLLRLDSHLQSVQEKVWVDIYVDNYPLPVMYGPVSSLFGAGLGWRPYQSSITGMSGDSLYINLPLPFRSSLKVNITNNSPESRIAAVSTEIVEQPASEIDPMRLSAVYQESLPSQLWEPYQACEVSGPGSLLGMFWEMQSTQHPALEGDVCISIDGNPVPIYNGTGTEDFFNGAFFWSNGSGPEPFQRPLCGMLLLAGGRCAAYRWLLSNPIPFHDQVRMTMEVGGLEQIQGYYRTTAWMYRRLPRWAVSDESGDGRSSSGETIRLVGYGLTPGAQITGVSMGDLMPGEIVGVTIVNSDSILNVSFDAPMEGSGTYPLVVFLDGLEETVQTDWIHQSLPYLDFSFLRSDIDSLVFAGDTLNISLHGLQPGASATIMADTVSLPWIGADTLADESRVIESRVVIPAGLPDTSLTLKAVSLGAPDAIAEMPLNLRSFFRIEFESLPVQSWRGIRYFMNWGPDNTPIGTTYPWGRNILQYLDANQQGDSLRFSFSIPDSGVYRISYFLAQGGGTAIAEALIDGGSDMQFDAYRSGLSSKIARTDTIPGSVRILSAGSHTLTMKAIGKNPSSIGYDLWLDQMIIQEYPNYPPEFSWISLAEADSSIGAYLLYWNDFDPDNNAEIQLFAYQGTDTFEINESPIWEDDENVYQWNLFGLEAGWYHLLAVIDDGISAVSSSSACSLYVSPTVLSSVEALAISIVSESGSDVNLYWNDSEALYYFVYRSASLDSVELFLDPFDVTTSNHYTLVDELVNGGEKMFYSVAAVHSNPIEKIRKSRIQPSPNLKIPLYSLPSEKSRPKPDTPAKKNP
jgi:hypothetical protein